jgi:quercetin dioxygenase-like cupin family protein
LGAGREFHNPVTRQRIRVVRSGADTGGELLELEADWEPGGARAPAHYHPHQDERFEVLSGQVRCVLDGEQRILGEGEVVEIPAGTPHEFGGHRDSAGRVRWETRPALRTEELFETLFGLAADGKVSERSGAPGVLQVAMILNEYGDVFRLAKPAWPVQRMLYALLAPIGRLRGYRPRYPEYAG